MTAARDRSIFDDAFLAPPEARVEAAAQAASSRAWALDDLLEGLRDGRYGGTRVEGEAPAAMMVMLAQLGWIVSAERFARAMPHFPTRFGMREVRDTLARLGFLSRHRVLPAWRLAECALPALCVDALGRFSVLARTGGGESGRGESGRGESGRGEVVLVDPMTGRARREAPHGPLEVASFRAAQPRVEPGSWFGAALRRFTPSFALLFGLTFVINLMVLAVSFGVMAVYEIVLPSEATDTLLALGGGLGAAMAIEFGLRRTRAAMLGRLSARLEFVVGSAVFGKILSLPIEQLSAAPIGAQLARIRQFEAVQPLIGGPFAALVLEAPFVLMFVAALFAFAGPIWIVPVTLILTFGVLTALLAPVVRRRAAEAQRARAAHQELALETASSLRTIRAFDCGDVWLGRLRTSTADAASARRRAAGAERLLGALSAAAVPLSGGATAIAGASAAIAGDLPPGALVASMIIVWRILAPIQQAFLMLTSVADAFRVVGQIDHLMRLPTTPAEEEPPVTRRFEGAVTLQRVALRYRGAAEPALWGVDVRIPAGSLVAVTGASGAGKSTLLRVLLDLYPAQSGAIFFDGVNIRQIPKTLLRRVVGYVPQEPTLFHGTIAQNLRLAAPDAHRAALVAICEEVGLLRVIEAMPEGIDTRLDHIRQSALPTGFRQSLATAQALLRDPRVLLLDEPAKAMDPMLEAALIGAVERRRGRTTTLLVTHRPSHARLADFELRLEEGRVVRFAPAGRLAA